MSYGLLGISDLINGICRKKREVIQKNNDLVTREEMQIFCNEAAKRNGITRGINLLNLQYKIADENYRDEEIGMKNEDAIAFLEKEDREIQRRKEAMFHRMSKLPTEKLKELAYDAEAYVERKGIDFSVEDYVGKITGWAESLSDEVKKDIAILNKGANGEAYVSQQLKLYRDKYRVLENIVIESCDSQGETSEVDTYIITDKGLVVAEVKNFGNENQRLHITSDGRWVIEDVYNGRVLKRIDKSPVEQNARHCLAVERLLKKEFGEECNIPIIPVVFIANNKVAIQNDSHSSVIRVSEFYTFISTVSNDLKISKKMQEEIAELLEKKNIGAREFKVKSRLQKMKCLEELEEEFTKYILYNYEVAQEYQKVSKRNKAHVSSTIYWMIAFIPYVLIFLVDLTTTARIVALVMYTACIFSIPLGIIGGVLLFVFWDMIMGLLAFLFIGILCGGLAIKN